MSNVKRSALKNSNIYTHWSALSQKYDKLIRQFQTGNFLSATKTQYCIYFYITLK